MNKISATEAKQSLGMLLDNVQHKPIEIQRQGRGVAVILSMNEYMSLKGEKMSDAEASGARSFLKKWAGKIKSVDFDLKITKVLKPCEVKSFRDRTKKFRELGTPLETAPVPAFPPGISIRLTAPFE
jgi:prevent-host-death family protein